MSIPISVHVLWHGQALCGNLPGPPRRWGNSARWIGANDLDWKEHATCPTCREQATLLERQLESERGYRAGVFMRPTHRPSASLLLAAAEPLLLGDA